MLIAAHAGRLPLRDNSVQCVVTSPPYWGLRKYAGEQELVWLVPSGAEGGGDTACEHEWVVASVEAESTTGAKWANAASGHDLRTGGHTNRFKGDRDAVEAERVWQSVSLGTCVRCRAWRGAYGLEPTVEVYAASRAATAESSKAAGEAG